MAANVIRRSYEKLEHLPGGKTLFSIMVGRMAPYTGTIGARVVELGVGHSRVQMQDRKAVRNHLNSIHAIALMNLAEVSTGLALLYGLPDEARSILTGLSIDYVKKARGTLTAECRCQTPDGRTRQELEVHGEIRDEAGDVVARATARWLVGPKK